MNRLIALVVALVAVALLAAGCGSSDDSTTDSTTSLTKAEFLKQGNAICAAGNKEIEEAFEELSFDEKKGPSTAELEEITEDTLAPSVSKQIDELRELGAPSGDEETVNTILDNAEAAVEEIEEDPGSIAGNRGRVAASATDSSSARRTVATWLPSRGAPTDWTRASHGPVPSGTAAAAGGGAGTIASRAARTPAPRATPMSARRADGCRRPQPAAARLAETIATRMAPAVGAASAATTDPIASQPTAGISAP